MEQALDEVLGHAFDDEGMEEELEQGMEYVVEVAMEHELVEAMEMS